MCVSANHWYFGTWCFFGSGWMYSSNKTHLVRVRKTSCFGSKYMLSSTQTWPEIVSFKITSGCTLANVEPQSWTLAFNSTTVPSTSRCESPMINLSCERDVTCLVQMYGLNGLWHNKCGSIGGLQKIYHGDWAYNSVSNLFLCCQCLRDKKVHFKMFSMSLWFLPHRTVFPFACLGSSLNYQISVH